MVSESVSQAYEAARHRVVSLPRTGRAWIVVSGKDRASYLQGLLTNDIVALQAGQGCYAAYLTPQGRLIADLAVHELGDLLLLDVPLATRQTVLSRLDQFIFSEDVQLGDVTDTFAGVSIIGPGAGAMVAQLVAADPDTMTALPAYGSVRTTMEGGACIVLRSGDRGVEAFDLLVEPALLPRLTAALDEAGVPAADPAALEALRIEAGLPVFGRDMDEEILPLEAGIEARAISFTKGCYVGQEVIIRVLHRGHGRVAKKLVGLTVDGDAVPAAGTPVETDGKAIGKVTSAAWSPRLARTVALAYVHRDALAPGTAVQVSGRDGVVSALPFA